MTRSNKDNTVLVTGGSGFIAVHCILKLLQQEYTVKSTLRSLSRANEVKEMLKNGGITSFDNLSFIEADLTNDKNWKEAVQGCAYVLHIASPTPISCYVDVRDVADLHLLAMTSPKASGERFLATSGNALSMLDVAMILKRHLGDDAKNVPAKEMPDWIIKIVALFNPSLRKKLFGHPPTGVAK